MIVGAPFLDPWAVVEKLLPLLAPSAPFVIYHPYLQVRALELVKLVLSYEGLAHGRLFAGFRTGFVIYAVSLVFSLH